MIGRDGLRRHDLRHLAATLAASTGAGVKEIMYRIGHSSPQAALRYQHATLRRDAAIAEGISRSSGPTWTTSRDLATPTLRSRQAHGGPRDGLRDLHRDSRTLADQGSSRAGDGNRTRVLSLGS
jgi:hypothetical protein